MHTLMEGKSLLSFEDVLGRVGNAIAEVKNPNDIIEAFVAFDKVSLHLSKILFLF